MPTQIQLRRGTTAENAAFTGAVGELTMDTTTNGLIVHDGSTAGGNAVGGGSSVLTTKGDVATFSTVDARLPVGTNDQVLTADSAEATGVKWADAAGGMTGVWVNDSTNANYFCVPHNWADVGPNSDFGQGANVVSVLPAWFLFPTTVTSLGIPIRTADAASTDNRAAIYAQHPTTGLPGAVLAETGHLSGASATYVSETLGTPLVLHGLYWFAFKTDSLILKMQSIEMATGAIWGCPLGVDRETNKMEIPSGVTAVGAFPASPTWTGVTSTTAVPIIGFK